MYTRRRIVLAGLASFPIMALPGKPEVSYEEKIKQERVSVEGWLKGEDSPLTLISYKEFDDGVFTLGQDPSCSYVIPVVNARALIGELTVKEGKTTLRFSPGVQATNNGKQVDAVSTDLASSKIVNVKIGSLGLMLLYTQTKRMRVRVFDSNFVKNRVVQPPSWFPIDPKYQLTGTWIAFPEPKTIRLPDSNGESREWKSLGFVEFVLDGQKRSLTPITNPPPDTSLFFVFGDTTNGHESYGGGRFLSAEAPRNGKVMLDFNEAHNPLCAYNHLYICPLARKENRLSVPVRAGELTYPDRLG